MSEAGRNSQPPKSRTCGLALASLGLGATAFITVFALALFVGGPIVLWGPFISLAGIICGIAALVKIQQRANLLKGRMCAIFGIAVCSAGQILAIYIAGLIIFHGHQIVWREICAENLRNLASVIKNYSSRHDGRYPFAAKWCDVVVTDADDQRTWFACPTTRDSRCSYAINPNCEPNSPPDMVLLFETKGGWNQFGGPETLTTENHNGKGCNILFNNGRVEFVKKDQLGVLKWKLGQSQTVNNK